MRLRPSQLIAGADELRHLGRTSAGRVLIGTVGAIALFTVVALALMWPSDWRPVGKAAFNSSLAATVDQVIDKPCSPPDPELCRTVLITVEGRKAQLGLTFTRLAPSLHAGDSIRVRREGRTDIAPAANARIRYQFSEVDRRSALAWLAAIAAGLAVALLRWRGVLAVLGVGLSLTVVVSFLIPAILAGSPALLVALVAALAVMFVTIVLTNGIGAQSLAAALGVSATLGLTCLVAELAVRWTDLGTITSLALLPVAAQTQGVSLIGITMAAMLIGALGVLADTAVTQASAVMALRRTAPQIGFARLFREAFVVGRDHLCATIHTLVLAYVAAALPLLLTVRSSGVADVDIWNNQEIAEPIVATIVGCLALIAAIPLSTGLAAALVARLPVAAIPDGHHHHHH